MLKFLTYDLETTFLQKGQRRTAQRILEIALYSDEFKYQKLVNPCAEYDSGEQLISSLDKMNQHPQSSLRFWTKLLIEKSALPSQYKRKDVFQQADAISKLLVRSDTAFKQAEYTKHTPQQWLYALENHHDKVNVAKQYLDKYKVHEKPKSLLFYKLDEALTGALKLGKDYSWIAHNGNSFDMPIVKGNCERNNISYEHVVFRDSLPMFRKKLKMDSYSQPNIYRNVFGTGYKAHHAFSDAKALYELLVYTANKEKTTILDLFTVKKFKIGTIQYHSDLLEIKGIGQKTLAKLKARGIHNQKQLYEFVKNNTHEQFIDRFKGLHRYKKLADELYE